MTVTTDTRIREFEIRDKELLQRLISATIDNTFLHFYPMQAINFFKALYSGERLLERSKNGKVVVLEKKGLIVGAGFILANEIRGVFVNPAFQHQGYGRKLMLELEQIAASNNYRKVSLPLALPSKGFYEGLGYQIIKECSIEVKNGKHLHYWTATKELGEQESPAAKPSAGVENQNIRRFTRPDETADL